MTNDELRAIRARADAATPGPWLQFDDGGVSSGLGIKFGPEYADCIWTNKGPGHGTIADFSGNDQRATPQTIADAEFIRNARDDVPALLDEVERLRARVEELEKELEAERGAAPVRAAPCPGCLGSGHWETECCNGSGGCSCRGQVVDMGRCNVCGGTGSVIPGQHNPRANRDMIKGMMYIGSGPRR